MLPKLLELLQDTGEEAEKLTSEHVMEAKLQQEKVWKQMPSTLITHSHQS